MIPECLALAKNFSLQVSHSSCLPEKFRTQLALKSDVLKTALQKNINEK
jgi:hypothetical protein